MSSANEASPPRCQKLYGSTPKSSRSGKRRIPTQQRSHNVRLLALQRCVPLEERRQGNSSNSLDQMIRRFARQYEKWLFHPNGVDLDLSFEIGGARTTTGFGARCGSRPRRRTRGPQGQVRRRDNHAWSGSRSAAQEHGVKGDLSAVCVSQSVLKSAASRPKGRRYAADGHRLKSGTDMNMVDSASIESGGRREANIRPSWTAHASTYHAKTSPVAAVISTGIRVRAG